MNSDDDFAAARARMVAHHLSSRDITDPLVLDVMSRVPRELFVPEHLRHEAYADHPLPIGDGQTISQPYIVALMTQALCLDVPVDEAGIARPQARVLEIGTGSGYAAAVLAELAARVITIERIPNLVDLARRQLADAGYDRVEVISGDGTLGWPADAPYDGIVVTAGGPDVPAALVDQLADGGRLVMPVGSRRGAQSLVRVTRTGDTTRQEDLGGVRFVPLIGDQGW